MMGYTPLSHTTARMPPPFDNFINCVRTRNRAHLNAEILEGHRSALLCHLGNASYRLGEEIPFDQQAKALGMGRVVRITKGANPITANQWQRSSRAVGYTALEAGSVGEADQLLDELTKSAA